MKTVEELRELVDNFDPDFKKKQKQERLNLALEDQTELIEMLEDLLAYTPSDSIFAFHKNDYFKFYLLTNPDVDVLDYLIVDRNLEVMSPWRYGKVTFSGLREVLLFTEFLENHDRTLLVDFRAQKVEQENLQLKLAIENILENPEGNIEVRLQKQISIKLRTHFQ